MRALKSKIITKLFQKNYTQANNFEIYLLYLQSNLESKIIYRIKRDSHSILTIMNL